MAESGKFSDWVDRYVRGALSEAEEAEFENALLDSAELQDELEAALALKETLRRSPDPAVDTGDVGEEITLKSPGWQKYAVAAALVLAVLNLGLYWKEASDRAVWQSRYENLSDSLGEVLTVPVEIMRSSNANEPGVIIRKPRGRALVLLDIASRSNAQETGEAGLQLFDESNHLLRSWSAKLDARGRIVTAIPASELPLGRVWLEISVPGEPSDRRLIEFR